MEGRQGRQELGLSRNGRMLAGFSYRVKLLGPQSQALVRQLPLPATSPPQKQHHGHWVMLEGPSKSLSAHRMALQLCFDMPIPRISSNQAENTSYPMGIKQWTELSSLVLSGSYKTHFREYLHISTTTTIILFPSPAFICYARACTSTPIAISVGICTLVNINNVWLFFFSEEKLIKFISKCFPNLKLLPAISISYSTSSNFYKGKIRSP